MGKTRATYGNRIYDVSIKIKVRDKILGESQQTLLQIAQTEVNTYNNNMIIREKTNPIIKALDVPPSRDDFEVFGVFNAAAIAVDKRTFLLLRVSEKVKEEDSSIASIAKFNSETKKIEKVSFNKNDQNIDCSDPRTVKTKNNGNFITSMGHLRGAWSDDGINFIIDKKPLLAAGTILETYGVEDPRITFIDGKYIITYAAISDDGIGTVMAVSEDLKSIERKGLVFLQNNKNVVIFPEKINGLYWALHRPFNKVRTKESIWIATSTDLIHWGQFKKIVSPGPNAWDVLKVGPGAPPIKTEKGWLEIYHGVDEDEKYSLGVVLLDANDPSKVIGRSKKPFLFAEEIYETDGLVKNIVFTCGAVKRDNGRIDIYYGASDDTMCLASIDEKELLEYAE